MKAKVISYCKVQFCSMISFFGQFHYLACSHSRKTNVTVRKHKYAEGLLQEYTRIAAGLKHKQQW